MPLKKLLWSVYVGRLEPLSQQLLGRNQVALPRLQAAGAFYFQLHLGATKWKPRDSLVLLDRTFLWSTSHLDNEEKNL